MSVTSIDSQKRPEQLDPNLLEAQSLKIAILRLLNAYQTPCAAHPDDWQYDVYGLVLVLGRRRTVESCRAFLDLLDFIVPDVIAHAMSEVAQEDPATYLPLLKARIGQPLCSEALREKPYVDPMKREARDRGIQGWIDGYERWGSL